MNDKQKKLWLYYQQLLKNIEVIGFPPFNEVRWDIAISGKKVHVLGTVQMPNAENCFSTLNITNSFTVRGKLKAKRFAYEVYKILEDMAVHEIGEHFLFRGRRAFNQHDNDWRYKSKKLEKSRNKYEKWIILAEQQREEMQ